MATETFVRARISGDIKAEATHVLGELGLSVSDAIRMLLIRVAREKALPFDVKVPNAETRAAMAELEAGKGRRVRDVPTLMAELNEDD